MSGDAAKENVLLKDADPLAASHGLDTTKDVCFTPTPQGPLATLIFLPAASPSVVALPNLAALVLQLAGSSKALVQV